MASRVILHGMHRSPNFGDVLLTQILRDYLNHGEAKVVALLAPTEKMVAVFGTKRAEITELSKADAFILGGGGFFQRMDGPGGSLKALMKYGLPLWLARVAGKRTAIIGAGAAPMPRRWLDHALAWMVGSCDVIAVRDETSYAYFKRLLGPRAKLDLHQVSDLVFAIDKSWLSTDDTQWATEMIQEIGTPRVLGVHLSEPPSSHPAYDYIVSQLAVYLGRRADTGIVLLEDHPSKSNQQAAANLEIQQRLPNIKLKAIPYPGVERLAALLESLDAVLTSKLHVALCAATMGTMPFALAKHRKNLASFDDIGIVENCCVIDASNPSVMEPIISNFSDCHRTFEVPNEVRDRARMALEIAKKFAVSD